MKVIVVALLCFATVQADHVPKGGDSEGNMMLQTQKMFGGTGSTPDPDDDAVDSTASDAAADPTDHSSADEDAADSTVEAAVPVWATEEEAAENPDSVVADEEAVEPTVEPHQDPEAPNPYQAFAMSAYDFDLTSKFENKSKADWASIANSVEINRPIAEVRQAITTSYLWVVCYPDTVGVGGVAKRPFKAGDIILEKFLFASKDYSLIRYQVDTLQDTHIIFHGDRIVMGNELPSNITVETAQFLNSHIGGSFEYNLTALNPTKTKWTRRVHFYHNLPEAHPLFVAGRKYFKHMLKANMFSQQYGAALYVECVRRFLESADYESELYSSPEIRDDNGSGGRRRKRRRRKGKKGNGRRRKKNNDEAPSLLENQKNDDDDDQGDD